MGISGNVEARPDEDAVTDFLQRLHEAYVISRPYGQTMRLYVLEGLAADIPLTEISSADLPALFDREHERREILVDPRRGALLDLTNPKVRSARGRLNVLLATPEGFSYSIERLDIPSGARQTRADRVRMPEGSSNLAAPVYMPAKLDEVIAAAVRIDGTAEVRSTTGVIEVVLPRLKQTFRLDPSDYTVLEFKDESDPQHVIEKRYLDSRANPLVRARLPAFVLTRVIRPGRAALHTCMVFGPIAIDPQISAADFQWSSYADIAVDERENAVIDKQDRLLGSIETVFGPAPAPSKAENRQYNQTALNRRNADPAQLVLPGAASPFRSALLITAASAFILAALWILRQRLVK